MWQSVWIERWLDSSSVYDRGCSSLASDKEVPFSVASVEAMQVSVVRHHHASVVRLIVGQQAEERKGLILFPDHHHVIGHAL